MDDFEQFLKNQPLKAVPPEWRGEILAIARKGKTAAAPVTGWRGWLWPSPYAWGALAAVWVAIFVLNSAAEPKENRMMAQVPTATSEELIALMNEQRREMEEFTPAKKAVATAPAEPAKANKPGALLEKPRADKFFHV